MFHLVACFFGIILVTIALVVVYYVIYTRRINRNIQNGVSDKRKMLDIPKVIMTMIIVVLIIFCIILNQSLSLALTEKNQPSRDYYEVIDVTNPDKYRYRAYFGEKKDEDANFAKRYSLEENEGYEKEVVEDEGITYTIFKRTMSASEFQPDYLCYVSFSKEKMQGIYGYESVSYKKNGETLGSIGADFSDFQDKTYLYVGNVDKGTEVTIHFDLLDEEDMVRFEEANAQIEKSDETDPPSQGDYAKKHSEVRIIVE